MRRLFVKGCLFCALCILAFAACKQVDEFELLRPYKVEFKDTKGEGTPPPAQFADRGSSTILPHQGKLYHPDLAFNGWNTEPDGAGTTYAVGYTYRPDRDITTLYAKWGNVFTVTFHPGEGDGKSSSQDIFIGSSMIIPHNIYGFENTGYYFDGWNTQVNGGGTDYNAGVDYKPTRDITLYAKWKPNYTVTFDSQVVGISVPSQSVIPGKRAYWPPEPKLPDHYLYAWCIDPAGNKEYDFADPVNGNITLYAKWIVVPDGYWVVVFDSGEGSHVETQLIREGNAATSPANPTRDHYTFGGWYSDPGLNTLYTFPTTPPTATTNHITLYAKWNPIPHTVTFNSNGGTPALTSQLVYGGTTVIQPTDPTRSGYYLEGWYSNSGLTTPYPFSTPVDNSSPLIAYAKWTALLDEVFTVVFDSNEGTHVTTQRVLKNGTATPTNPTRLPGYTFGGWCSDAGLTTTYVFTTPVTGNITLYAKWNAIEHTVTFISNGETSVPSQNIIEGNKVIYPTDPIRSGCIFEGWYDVPNPTPTTKKYDFSVSVTEPITLYAKWIGIGNGVTMINFDSNGGNYVPSIIVRSDGTSTAAKPSPNPTRNPYRFGEWYRESGLTNLYDFNTPVSGTASDITYTPAGLLT